MNSKNYLDFENRFRGNYDSVCNQFSSYDELINLIIKDVKDPKFIDIGCGRGEWLDRWTNKVSNCIGIECNSSMVELCRSRGLNVLEGDAIRSLKEFKNSSISVITIFHMIEHLEHENLIEILEECDRILRPDGILILETPSIDNILVSTNTFYIDHTHITHINTEALIFLLENMCFSSVKCFPIHGGPLENASHSKMTRILNGVAQDMMIIALKDQSIAQILFKKNQEWLKSFDIGLTTMQAAIEFDLRNEKFIQEFENEKKLALKRNFLLGELNQEINLLKNQLKYIIFILKLIKRVVKFFLYPFKFIPKLIIHSLRNLKFFLIKFKFLKTIILSNNFLAITDLILKYLPFKSSRLSIIDIKKKFKKLESIDDNSINSNHMLWNHYKYSSKAKSIKSFLKSKL